MSEVSIENDAQAVSAADGQEVRFEPVCIDVPRIYDSCGAKDCLRDLTDTACTFTGLTCFGRRTCRSTRTVTV